MKKCRTGKVRHSDKLAAKIALATMREKGAVRYYHCNECRGWHLTSEGKKGK